MIKTVGNTDDKKMIIIKERKTVGSRSRRYLLSMYAELGIKGRGNMMAE